MRALVKREIAKRTADKTFEAMDAVMLGWLLVKGFGRERMMKFYVQYAIISDRYRARYGVGQRSHEAALKRDMEAVGVHPLREIAETVHRAETRRQALAVLEELDLMTMCAMRDAFGWGKKKLEEAYEPLAVCHRIFLQVETAEDGELIRKSRDALKEKGIDTRALQKYTEKVLAEREERDKTEKVFEDAKQRAIRMILAKDTGKDWMRLVERIEAGERSGELLAEILN